MVLQVSFSLLNHLGISTVHVHALDPCPLVSRQEDSHNALGKFWYPILQHLSVSATPARPVNSGGSTAPLGFP